MRGPRDAAVDQDSASHLDAQVLAHDRGQRILVAWHALEPVHLPPLGEEEQRRQAGDAQLRGQVGLRV